jgi:beta-lactamase class A
MVEAFYQAREGRTPLDSLLLLDKENMVQGSGILQDLSDGLILSLRDALTLMIVLSDNTATNMVIDSVGIDAVNSRMVSLGLVHTKLFKKVFLPPPKPSEDQKKFGLGVTTPAEMVKLLEMLARGDLVDKASSEAMISILKKQRDRDQIPRYISYDDLGESVGGIQVANKTGALDRVRNDVGLVFTRRGTYLMAIFTWNSADTRWTPDNAATLTIAQLARVLFEHFESAGTTP